MNVGELIRNQVPDRHGEKIPLGTETGSYEFKDLDDLLIGYLYEGKQAVDKEFGLVTYGCAMCCFFDDAWISGFTDNTGASRPIPGYGVQNCGPGGQIVDITGSIFNWFSGNTGVASVTPGFGTGVNPGSTSSSGSVNLRGYYSYKSCPLQTQNPTGPMDVVPRLNVAYSSYIPVDHVGAPTSCGMSAKIYKCDGGRGTYRTTESIFITPDTRSAFGFFAGTGETRNYAAGSPAVGGTLSQADEDNIQFDCQLWNDKGTASPFGFVHEEAYPYLHQGQVRFAGSSSNPLEASAPINWDIRTVLDTTNPLAPTAFVNYNHTCYPAHQVKVNGLVVYRYTPPSNDVVFITNCLFFQNNKIIGQTAPVTVPAF